MSGCRVNVCDMDEDLPRAKPDDVVAALIKQDLDRLSVGELDERIVALEAEVIRTKAKRDGASKFRSAADSLFERG
ncbi:DUF1192 domain-containing protein [Glacieibacterium megasporae]|uniref:DUF1192 domain-containing protein n=1 Tax=Glacieibacterium megasporae TaxID=2835787 RepID=UPI0034E198D0